MLFDDEAQPLNANYADYLLPIATDMPEIEIIHLEEPSPLNPIGVKGAGEGGTIPATACVISAIEDALAPFGVRDHRAPGLAAADRRVDRGGRCLGGDFDQIELLMSSWPGLSRPSTTLMLHGC